MGNPYDAAIKQAQQDELHQLRTSGQQYLDAYKDLAFIRDGVRDYTTGINSNIQTGYDNASGQVQQLAQALQGQLRQQSGQGRGQISSVLSRLGIGGQGLGSLGSYDQSSQSLQGLAANNSTNNLANLQAMKGSANEVGQLLLGMNQGTFAQNFGQQKMLKTKAWNDTRYEADKLIASLKAQRAAAAAAAAAARRSSSGGGGGGSRSGGGGSNGRSSGGGSNDDWTKKAIAVAQQVSRPLSGNQAGVGVYAPGQNSHTGSPWPYIQAGVAGNILWGNK